jgi:hypothetical protein
MGLRTSIPNTLAQPGVCTSTTRPLAPYEGQLIYQTDTDDTFIWNGSQWIYLHDGVWDNKGDLLVGTGQSVGTLLTVGPDESILVADSGATEGMSWSNTLSVAGASVTGELSATSIVGSFYGQVIVTVKNNTVSTIDKSTPVYISGEDNGVPEVTQSINAPGQTPIGLLSEAIASGSTGKLVIFGVIGDLDTSPFDGNDVLWLTESGTLSNVRPILPGQIVQPVARVLFSHPTGGAILVTSAVQYLESPNTIDISGSITTELSLNGDSATITNGLTATAVSGTTSVSSPEISATSTLTVQGVEIDTSDAQIDEVLVYDGTKFAPANIDTGGKSFAYFMGA